MHCTNFFVAITDKFCENWISNWAHSMGPYRSPLPRVVVVVVDIDAQAACDSTGSDTTKHNVLLSRCTLLMMLIEKHERTRSIWKMLGPFATASRRTPIHQVSLPVLSHAACASMSTTTTTTRGRGDRYCPMEWAQLLIQFSQNLSISTQHVSCDNCRKV